MNKEEQAVNRREYVRLDTVFPVQFRVVSLDGGRFFCTWQQGFTNNIGKGGICLRVNHLDPELTKIIKKEPIRISLEIDIPFGRHPVTAVAKVSWVKDVIKDTNKYLIGLRYEQIKPESNRRVMRYVWGKKIFIPALWCAVFILGAGFFYNSYLNIKLINGNKALVGKLVNVLQESTFAKQRISEISKDRAGLDLKIQALQVRIQTVEEEKKLLKEGAKQEEEKVVKRIEELNAQIGKLSEEKAPLQEQLIALQHREDTVPRSYCALTRRR